MTGLHIPAEAVATGATSVFQTPPIGDQVGLEIGQIYSIVEIALAAAAPFIVADAFRRFADDNRGKWNTAARVMIALRAEADKLDRGTS